MTNYRANVEKLKAAARGRELEILEIVAGIPRELLDKKGHACPKCGGSDRFSLIDADAGAVMCRKCFSAGNGDVIAAVQWMLQVEFREACRRIAVHLGIDGDSSQAPTKDKPTRPSGSTSKSFPTADAAITELERRHGPHAALWTYHDANDNPVGLIVRWDLPDGRKDIRPVSRHADEWQAKGMKVPRPLYRVPSIGGAEVVIVCEGEKTADAAIRIGFTATTSPHGSQSAAKADWQPLAGKSVVILPDNDEAGRKYAEQVAGILTTLTPPAEVRIVELPALAEADDIVDWIAAGGTREKLQGLIDETARWQGTELSWPEPTAVVSTSPAAPKFDPMLLPFAFRGFVCDVAERMQAPPDFAAVAMMIVAAVALGARIAMRPKSKDDWIEVPNLWGAVIGRPSLLKTPSIREPLKMLHRLQTEEKKRYAAELEELGSIPAIAKAEVKNLTAAIEKSIRKGERAKAIELAKQLKLIESGGEVPKPRRYIVNDATIEKLGEILEANPLGVLQYRDELLGFLWKFENEQYAGDRAAWLELWDGKGCHITDRIGRGTIEIERACASLIGSIQPAPLQAYFANATDGGAGDDGLIQRFQLMVWPEAEREWKLIDRYPNSRAKTAAWDAIVRMNNLDPIEIGAEFDDADRLPFLRFSQGAQLIFNEWLTSLELVIRADDIHPAIESHLAKYRGLMPTLAMLCHLVDGCTGPVGEESARRAVAWCNYLEGHARRIYHAAEHPEVSAAIRLMTKIANGSIKDGFVPRDIYRKGWQGLDRDATAKALEVLLEQGWLKKETTQIEKGPQKTVYRIHPTAFDEWALADKAARTDISQKSDGTVSRGSKVGEERFLENGENEVVEWTA